MAMDIPFTQISDGHPDHHVERLPYHDDDRHHFCERDDHDADGDVNAMAAVTINSPTVNIPGILNVGVMNAGAGTVAGVLPLV